MSVVYKQNNTELPLDVINVFLIALWCTPSCASWALGAWRTPLHRRTRTPSAHAHSIGALLHPTVSMTVYSGLMLSHLPRH